ncbi:hypothetical protein [Hydrocarboniphaga sp.]|uniref:hypothetical protein n=1 Tax=Hydrocarboniphaga sp. TaxID=2033016 RepID=UPI003D14C28C
MTPIIDDAACDDILRWLDAHSVSLSQGLPAQLLHRRWAEAGREPEQLGSALKKLFVDDWIALTPNSDPPHLRFTVEGYRRLIEALALPAAVAEPPPAATPATATATAAEPASTAGSPAQRPHLSELRLRNDILGVYRELRLKADARLIGMTLSRYWQEMGHRAGELRTGLDVVVRDGLLLPRLIGMDRYWQLTRDGEAWLQAPRSPDALLRLAPPLAEVQTAPTAEEAHRLVAKQLAGLPADVGYEALHEAWQRSAPSYDDNALLTGLDLLLRHGHARLGDGDAPRFTLSDRGRAFASEEPPRFAKLLAAMNKVLG